MRVSSRILTDKELLQYSGQTIVRDLDTAQDRYYDAKRQAELTCECLQVFRNSWWATALRAVTANVTTGQDHSDALIIAAATTVVVPFLPLMLARPSLWIILWTLSTSLALYYWEFYRVLRTQPGEITTVRQAERIGRFSKYSETLQNLEFDKKTADQRLQDAERLVRQIRDATRRAHDVAALMNTDLRTLSGHQFEHYLGQVFRVLGYSEVVVTKGSGDQGVDLIVGDGVERVAIQAKLHQKPVGNTPVQEVFLGGQIHGCTRCVVIAPAGFTKGAYVAGRKACCRLIDGAGLRRIICGVDQL